MLIPKQILALGKIVAKYPGRYAMDAIRIERRDDQPRALATDGHRGILFTWVEPDERDYPAIEGMSADRVAGFSANVGPRALADAAKGTPGRGIKPILDFVLLDESDEKTIHLAATTLDRVVRAQALAHEGTFPPVEQVIPQPARERNVYDPARHGPLPFTHVRIAVDARLMAQTLIAMASLTGEGDNSPVVLTVPTVPSQAIRLDSRASDRRAIGVVMPVAMAGELEEQEPSPQPQTQPEAAPAGVGAVPPAEPSKALAA